MTLLALTGGIASGKSTIAARLVQLGAIHIDADQLAREAVAPGTVGLAGIVRRFGSHMLTENGTLDRAKLAANVFHDSLALADLNTIIHPEVRALATRRIAAAQASSEHAVVVYDVPLLVESDVRGDWDAVIVAEAPISVRLERLTSLRGMSEAEAQQRITAQATDEQRRAIADTVIDTSGSLDDTMQQVDQLWVQITHAPTPH